MKIHKKTTSNYTVVTNNILQYNLSLRAIGLYLYIVNKPDEWNFTDIGVTTQVADGRTSVRSAIAELEEAGFLYRHRDRRADGTLAEAVWIVTDEPKTNVSPTNVSQTNVGKTNTGFRTQVNTNIVNTKKDNSNKGETQKTENLPKGLAESLTDNLSEEKVLEIAQRYKITPEVVLHYKEAYLLWVQDKPEEKNRLGRNMAMTVQSWLLRDIKERKIKQRRTVEEYYREVEGVEII